MAHGGEQPMPTIEGKQAGIWIDDYVKKAGKCEDAAKAVRALVKRRSREWRNT